MSIQSFEIGATYAGRVNIETLTTKKAAFATRSTFFPFGESLVTGSRARITRGAPYAIWDFGWIYLDMFNAFRALCPGGSAAVVIRTLKEDYSTYQYYDCVMIWPALDSYEQVETTKGIGYQPFSLRFDNLIVYVP